MHLRFDGPVFSGWAPFSAADAACTMACCLKFLTVFGCVRSVARSNAWERSAAIPIMARRPNTRKRWSCDKEDYQVTRMTASAGDETEGIREILGRQQIIVCVRASHATLTAPFLGVCTLARPAAA